MLIMEPKGAISMKKLLSLFLACLLLLSCVSAASAAAEKASVLPVVDLRGFMSSQIYADKDDPDSERLFPPEPAALIRFATALLPSITRFTFDNNWDVLGNQLIPALRKLLLPVSADENGDVRGNTGPLFTYPTKDEIAANPDVEFVFDWRDDPFKSAAQLAALIDYITDDCGYGKVALECHSYAGIVTLTYLAVYGTKKVTSVCFNATAVYGAVFAGELMQGKVNLNADGLAVFLEGLLDQTEYEGLLRGLVKVFDDLGGLNFLCSFVNELFEHLSSRIWKEAVVPVFGSWLSIWDMVPDSEVEAGNAFIASTGTTLSDTFRARIDKFDAEIRTKREPLLLGVNEKCSLYVIARYGYGGVPLGDTWTADSDGVLTTEAESFGATCQPFDYTSPTVIIAPLRAPSGAIDASTCLFPQQTWFIRNCKHTEKDPVLREFSDTLLRADGQQNIQSFPRYPQFLVLEKALGGLIPDDGFVRSPRKWQDDLRTLLQKMIEKIKAALRLPFVKGTAKAG